MKIKSFFHSFGFALCGIATAIHTERNLRFHLVAGGFAVYFASLYHLSMQEWAILSIAIGLMIASELINTAIEYTVDRIGKEYSPLAKQAKDAASGAVFVLACTSLCVAVCIFRDWERIKWIFQLHWSQPQRGLGVFLFVLLGNWFVFFWGRKRA